MSAIRTPEFGIVNEHLVGKMAVFGRLALELDTQEGCVPTSAEAQQRLEADAALLSGQIVAARTLEPAAA